MKSLLSNDIWSNYINPVGFGDLYLWYEGPFLEIDPPLRSPQAPSIWLKLAPLNRC